MTLFDKTQIQIDNESQKRVDEEQGIRREGVDKPGGYPVGFDPATDRLSKVPTIGDPKGTGDYTPFYEAMFDPVRDVYQGAKDIVTQDNLAQNIGLGDITRLFGQPNEQTGRLPFGADWMGIAPDSSLNPYLRRLTKEGVAAVPGTEGRFVTPSPNEPTQRVWVPGTTAQQAIPPEYETRLNPL